MRRWRPSLWLVTGGALAGTLILSLLGLIALRYLAPVLGFRWAALVLALAIGALTLIPWALMQRLILGPVRALSDYAAQVRARPGHMPDPPGRYGTAELREMGKSVTDMAAVLQARETSVRAFADHVTHEVKGPVAAIRAASELLADGDLTPGDRALVAQIDVAARRIDAQLTALSDIARARGSDHRGTATLAGLGLTHDALDLRIHGGDIALPIAADGLRAILDHLLANAAHHGATRVMLTAAPGGLTVADDGTGISPGNRARVFDPFFTTRRDAGGTGMGLAIVDALMRANGGRVVSVDGGPGATFRLTWPRTGAP
ncbi:sensor histidine kinase [Jannaschia donghaensis]|uniref:histidine kinase n=1 Tax=Jannaschia donghaensis TaxID=420998 RepID=A0A0M6YDR8_9RHOB|nr:HAMP domain-containing sensor histidine kinase [Jannaschia donghaensis]CTQ48084.1 Sensor histidine kinase QseE [Jannaschia donghaensis]